MSLEGLEIALMQHMTQDQKIIFQMQLNSTRKNRTTALLLALFGMSRFYLDDTGLGILQWFLALVVVGIVWMFIDIFTAQARADSYNAAQARRVAVMITGRPELMNVTSAWREKSLLARLNETSILAKIAIGALITLTDETRSRLVRHAA